MKKMLGLVSAALGAGIFSVLAVTSRAAETPTNQPPFVDKETWLSVAPDLGIVLEASDTTASSSKRRLDSSAARRGGAPVVGYFMVRRNGVWRRLELEQPARLTELR